MRRRKAADDRGIRAPIEDVKDGYIALPAAPGLGIAVDEGALAQYGERVV